MPTEEEILAEVQALAEEVSTNTAVTASNLNRTRIDVSLSKANKDAAAISAGQASSAKTAAESAKVAAIAAKNATLIHVDGAVWFPDGWNIEDTFPVAASLVYGGVSYRALVANQNVEPGTDAETWMVILDIPPEVYEAKADAEAAATATAADRTAVAADKATTLASTTIATQKAAAALASEVASAASAASAAGSARDAADAALAAAQSSMGMATVAEDLAELDENTTALVGQILDGPEAGYYRRAIADDPTSDWELSSADWTIPRLGGRVDAVAGVRGPTVNLIEDGSGAVLPQVRLAIDGKILSAVTVAGETVAPGADGNVRPFAAERGPTANYTSVVDTVPVAILNTDRQGRLKPTITPDGAVLWPDAAGTIRSGARVERGPTIGCAGSEADSLIVAAEIDRRGQILSAQAAGSPWMAVSYQATPSGLVRSETPTDGPLVTVAGTSLKIPPARVPRSTGWLYTPAVVLASPEPGTAEVTGELINLRYLQGSRVAYQHISNVVVTRVSDSVVLTLGTHYRFDPERGSFEGLVSTADFQVSIDYTGTKVRSDIVSVSPVTGVMTLTQGTEIKQPASMIDPAVPAGDVPLYRVYRFAGNAELVPLYLYRRTVRIDRAASIEADIAEQRRRARRHRAIVEAKVRTGGTLRWGGEGDSITAMTAGGNPSEVNAAPNGPRQRISYFEGYDAAALALIPTEDLSDGYGNTYVKEGWNWTLLKHLIATYGVSVAYRNWGIGGTDSSSGTNGSFLQQGNASKKASVAADDLDILWYLPGMNELGASYTYANVKAICEYYLDAGIAMILGTPCRPNERWRPRLVEWRETCSQIEQVADELDIPCVRSRRLFEPSCLAGVGIGEREIADAGWQSHPGRRELTAIGRLGIELF